MTPIAEGERGEIPIKGDVEDFALMEGNVYLKGDGNLEALQKTGYRKSDVTVKSSGGWYGVPIREIRSDENGTITANNGNVALEVKKEKPGEGLALMLDADEVEKLP